MGARLWLVSVAAGVAALSVLGTDPAVAVELPSVTVDTPAEAAEGGTVVARLSISDVTALDAGQFDVVYDHEVLQLDDVTNGEIGGTQIPVDLWNEIDSGECRVVVNVPGFPGVSGSGYLATLTFHVVGACGDSGTLELSNGFLNNNLGEEIPAVWTGNSVTVGENADSPMTGTPVFRWWVLGAIVGVAILLITMLSTTLLLRRRRMLRGRNLP